MEPYPWWTKEQVQLSNEVQACADEVLSRWWESRWLQEFPRDIFELIGERRYAGAAIPKEYGGMGLGATGGCIVLEHFGRMPGLGRILGSSMFGGMRQLIEYGTEEQKKRFLPPIVEGELGAIAITETFAGTDASGMETTAVRDGDTYILNGKKRFIVSAGTADRYMVYARTSNDPDEIRAHRHLTAFIVKKGLPGFTVEKINEIMGFKNIQNGSLDFDNVRVPVADRIGEENKGWRVMTAGLNFERTLICAQSVGWFGELLNSLVPYTQRRVQFGRRTIDIQENQFKIADLVIKYNTAHLLTYYNAYNWDLGKDITIIANVAKVHNCEGALQAAMDAIQVMGGDGVTPYYSLEEIMNIAKVENIAGGSMEACRLVIFRTALKQWADEFLMRRRVIHPKLGVPVPASGAAEKEKDVDEEKLLNALAEDYRINPGLFMSLEDITELFDIDAKELDEMLISLENKGLVKLYRTKKGLELAKATYDGLRKAHPVDYYQWFPTWINRGDNRVF